LEKKKKAKTDSTSADSESKARNDLATTRLAIMERLAADPGKLV
jgi:hypothetical protein